MGDVDGPAILAEGLVKRFGSFTALDGLQLSVAEGEVHGFLGPNGAGKSTTIRVLLGLLRADDGNVRLLGGDPWREVVALHRRLAYVPGDVVSGRACHEPRRGGPRRLLRRPRLRRHHQRRAGVDDLDQPAQLAAAHATGDRKRPVAALAALAPAVAATLLAFLLQSQRDFGQGLIAPRSGPDRAGRTGSLWGLAARINRGLTLSWLTGFVAIGLLLGFLAGSVGDVIATNPGFAAFAAAGGGSSLIFGFLVTILQLAGLIAAVFGVQVVMRIYTEEINYRVEPLLAGAVHRPAYLASNAIVAFLGPSVAYLIGGIVIALIADADGTSSFGDVVAQTLATIPAVWVLIALALAAVGARPALRLVGWLGIVASFGLTLLGPTFKLPEWALGISPLHHVPDVTAPAPDWTALLALIAVAVMLTAVGFAGFRRRDVA